MNNHFYLLDQLNKYNKQISNEYAIKLLKEAINYEYSKLSADKKPLINMNTLSSNDVIILWDLYTKITGDNSNLELNNYKQQIKKLESLKNISCCLMPKISKKFEEDKIIKKYICDDFIKKIKSFYDNLENENNKSLEYYKSNNDSMIVEIINSQNITNDSIKNLQNELNILTNFKENFKDYITPSINTGDLLNNKKIHSVILITEEQNSEFVKNILHIFVANMIYNTRYNQDVNDNNINDNIYSIINNYHTLYIIHRIFKDPRFKGFINGSTSNALLVNNLLNLDGVDAFDITFNNNNNNNANTAEIYKLKETIFNNLDKIDESNNNLEKLLNKLQYINDQTLLFKIDNSNIYDEPKNLDSTKDKLAKINQLEIFNELNKLPNLLNKFDTFFKNIQKHSKSLNNINTTSNNTSIKLNPNNIFKHITNSLNDKPLDWMVDIENLSDVMEKLENLLFDSFDTFKNVRKFSNLCVNPSESSNMEKKYLKYKKKYLNFKTN